MRRETTGTPATLALARAGVEFTTHVYEHDPRSSSYGLEAAEALGLSPDEVFKTLMALVDDRPVIAVVPVSGSLDLKSLAAVAGGRRAEMADPVKAARLTGYVVGGISPIGQKRPLPTYVDETAELFDVVYVSGGRRGLDIGLAPHDLLRMADGQFAAISRSSGGGR